jgi:hypothetical protein
MTAARRRYLKQMAATLEEWSGQIADLEAKARSAGGEQLLLVGSRIAALCERRAAYQAHMNGTRDTSAGMLGDMRESAERIAVEFRRIYVQSESRFASEDAACVPRSGERAVAGRPADPTRTAGAPLLTRTSRTTVVFARPFSLKGVGRELPAGRYTIETEEELIEGLSFPAYHRVATTIFVPTRPAGAVSGEVLTIDPLELAAAQTRDLGDDHPHFDPGGFRPPIITG